MEAAGNLLKNFHWTFFLFPVWCYIKQVVFCRFIIPLWPKHGRKNFLWCPLKSIGYSNWLERWVVSLTSGHNILFLFKINVIPDYVIIISYDVLSRELWNEWKFALYIIASYHCFNYFSPIIDIRPETDTLWYGKSFQHRLNIQK